MCANTSETTEVSRLGNIPFPTGGRPCLDDGNRSCISPTLLGTMMVNNSSLFYVNQAHPVEFDSILLYRGASLCRTMISRHICSLHLARCGSHKNNMFNHIAQSWIPAGPMSLYSPRVKNPLLMPPSTTNSTFAATCAPRKPASSIPDTLGSFHSGK
jgi:hypothetical protein